MSRFKVGDVVVRTGGNYGVAIHGGNYVVSYVEGPNIKLVGDLKFSYDIEQFEPVPCVGIGATTTKDAVYSPSHYAFFPDLEAIQVIARAMTQEMFYGYCLGNRLKYRLRAGKKDALAQDVAKSDNYVNVYEQYKHLCHS